VKPLWIAGVQSAHHVKRKGQVDWSNGMRYVSALSLLITLSVSVDAATVSGAKPAYVRTRQHVIVRPSPGVANPERFAVPGWTDEATRRWLDDASRAWKGA